MNRRMLLKAAAAAGLSLAAIGLASSGALVPARAVAAAAPARLLRGAPRGRIYQSLNGGLTWELAADFGARCEVWRVVERDGRAYAQLALDGHSFELHSTDARVWRTAQALERSA